MAGAELTLATLKAAMCKAQETGPPRTMTVAPLPMVILKADRRAVELMNAGANWRRVKRERRKAFDQGLAEMRANAPSSPSAQPQPADAVASE